MHALILGATGATGSDLLPLLLADPAFDEVTAFTRRPLKIQNVKLKNEVVDFARPDIWKDKVRGDVLFSALGTSLRQAGSKEAQWQVDYTYQLQFAEAAKENGVSRMVLVSSAMASSRSSYFYMRMKGELEDAVTALNFPACTILQPPSLIRKKPKRLTESISIKVISLLNALGLFRSMRPMKTETLATIMVKAAKVNTQPLLRLCGDPLRTY